jgi:hypothetical protein
MAELAVFHRPGNLAIMAGTAKLATDDLGHIDLVATGFELEAEVGMTNLALKTDAVKPMGKDGRPHTGGIGKVVYDNIAIFGMCAWAEKRKQVHEEADAECSQYLAMENIHYDS